MSRSADGGNTLVFFYLQLPVTLKCAQQERMVHIGLHQTTFTVKKEIFGVLCYRSVQG